MPQHLAVIEWESSMSPTVIVGPDELSVHTLVINRITSALAPADISDAPTFLLEHPAPAPTGSDAAAATAAWIDALHEAATIPWVTTYTIPDAGAAGEAVVAE